MSKLRLRICFLRVPDWRCGRLDCGVCRNRGREEDISDIEYCRILFQEYSFCFVNFFASR